MSITGRPIYQKGDKSAKKRKRIRQISAKKAAYDASPEGIAGKAHMAEVAKLPCCICDTFGMVQLSKTRVHHCKDGEGRNDMETIQICGGHHNREDADNSKVSYHHRRDTWRDLYGEDIDWLPWVNARLGK